MSTIKVNRLENTSTANGGIDIDTDGHVQFDGLQMPTAGAFSNRNLVINGSFQVDQRSGQGTGFSYIADRFVSDPDGGTATSSRGTLTTGSPYDEGFRYFGRITNTAVITDTAAHFRFLNYKGFEAQDIAQSGWKYTDATSFVTLSFWVRSSVGGVFYGYLNAIDGTNSSLAFLIAGDGDSSLVADAWTKVTVSVPGHANLSFDLNANNGLNLYISPFLGTNRTASSVTAGAWQNYDGSARTPDAAGGQTWATTAGATWDITGVQLEVGSKATPFEHRSYGDELAKCLRYYYLHAEYVSGSSRSICNAAAYASSVAFGVVAFPIKMRVVPTMEVANVANAYRLFINGSSQTFNSFNTQEANFSSYTIERSSLSLTQGHAGWFRANDEPGAKLAFSAEL